MISPPVTVAQDTVPPSRRTQVGGVIMAKSSTSVLRHVPGTRGNRNRCEDASLTPVAEGSRQASTKSRAARPLDAAAAAQAVQAPQSQAAGAIVVVAIPKDLSSPTTTTATAEATTATTTTTHTTAAAAVATTAAAAAANTSSAPAVSRPAPEEYVSGPAPSPPPALLTTFLLPVANRACTPLDLSLRAVDSAEPGSNNISKLSSRAPSSRSRTLQSPFAASSSSSSSSSPPASCSDSPSSSLSSTVLLSSPCSPTSPFSPSAVFFDGPAPNSGSGCRSASIRRRYLSMSPVSAAGEMTGLDAAAAPRPAANPNAATASSTAADANIDADADADADAHAAVTDNGPIRYEHEYRYENQPGAATTTRAATAAFMAPEPMVADAGRPRAAPAKPADSDATPTTAAQRKGSRLRALRPKNGLPEAFISLPSWKSNPAAASARGHGQQRHELPEDHGDRHERQRLQDQQATPRPLLDPLDPRRHLHHHHDQNPLSQLLSSWPQQADQQAGLASRSPPTSSSIASLRYRVEAEFNNILQQQQQEQQQEQQLQQLQLQQRQVQLDEHQRQLLQQQHQQHQQQHGIFSQQPSSIPHSHSHSHPHPPPRPRQFAPSGNTPATVVAAPERGDLKDWARPSPIPIPIPKQSGRKHSDTFSSLYHPKPQVHATVQGISPSAHSSVALLEATAERLSLGSSPIGDAIRDLHCELKRSDSKRSAILAASVQADSTDEVNLSSHHYLQTRLPSVSTSSSYQYCFARQIAAHSSAALEASSINSFNQHVCAPEPARLTAEFERSSILSCLNPGRSSVKSVRSVKYTLAEIGESDPVTLDQDAFDQADAISVLDLNDDEITRQILEHDAVNMPDTDEFHQILEGGFSHNTQNLTLLEPGQSYPERHELSRPTTANSASTYQQAQEAFVDFDGVHCPVSGGERPFSPDAESQLAPPAAGGHGRPPSADNAMSPQEIIDPATGQPMIYYPARVPAMLNLPPKLSSKPKTAQRNARRSQILSVMMEEKSQPKDKRKSAVLGAGEKSWLPDPVSDHKNSFSGLSLDHHLQMVGQAAAQTESTPAGQAEKPAAATPLRRPPKLNKSSDQEKRKSKALQGDNINAHLRASAFFDFPAGAHEFEIKDGSAMATLDSILDASANAPVSAFTDHVYAGKLGAEVYGKERKHKPKKSSFGNNNNNNNHHRTLSVAGSDASAKAAGQAGEHAVRPSGEKYEDPEGQLVDNDADDDDNGGDDDEAEGAETYQGLPTTLLAELQLRKVQQKQRLRLPQQSQAEGMRATLLEMDAVAEVQRRSRQTKRVNLAWEGGEAAADPNGSDDEDVPLAIIAAMQQGARNMADVDRPFGLMEIRQMEENEPLRARQARLQGKTTSLAQAKRVSAFPLPSTRIGEVQPPAGIPIITPPSDTSDQEHEGETLGQRKKRLAETVLPQARPVSGAFSAELLSQFGDREEPAGSRNSQAIGANYIPNMDGEEETLGQRRRRLQSEREAREREMSYSNLIGGSGPGMGGPMDMGDMGGMGGMGGPMGMGPMGGMGDPMGLGAMGGMGGPIGPMGLGDAMGDAMGGIMGGMGGMGGGAFPSAAQPRKQKSLTDLLNEQRRDEIDPYTQQQLRKQAEQNRLSLKDAQMSALRAQMPTVLVTPEAYRCGGFMGGAFNDCSGGLGDEHDRLQSFDPLAEQKRQQEEINRLAMQDAKMAAIRSQMPAALVESPVGRAGGFRGGMYNDGSGGLVLEVTQTGTNQNNQTFPKQQDAAPRRRASMMMMMSGIMQQQQQQQGPYAGVGVNNLGGFGPNASVNNLGGYAARELNRRQSYCALGTYDNARMLNTLYGGGAAGNNSRASLGAFGAMPAAGLLSGSDMDRIERWRQSVAP